MLGGILGQGVNEANEVNEVDAVQVFRFGFELSPK